MKLHYGIAVASAKQLNDLPGLEKAVRETEAEYEIDLENLPQL